MKFKGTKGTWYPNVISTITIGVDAEISRTELGVYSQNVCEFILPDTDEEYEKERVEREANAKLISAAPDLLAALDVCIKSLCTYGSHPIIEQQVRQAFLKAGVI